MDELSIAQIQEKFQSGELTSLALTAAYLERIETLDRRGPALNSVIEINPEALSTAAALDQERLKQGARGPLHGVPLLVKDNIDTADRMTTTAGSLALEGSIAAADAFLVKRLRQAGVVLLGKTNLSEWANFRSKHSVSGWSSRGGQTLNPYVLDRNPCGSSSGSAVAAAANLCSAAVGTETDGSIVCPAAVNGIVGLKPTLGLVSRSGVIPIAHSQDTAGPMARCVADAALLLGAMAGPDPDDPATAACQDRFFSDFTRFLDPQGLQGARLGVVRSFFGANPRADAVIETCLQAMQRQGAQLVDPVKLPDQGSFEDGELDLLLYEFKIDLNAYLSRLGPGARVHSLADIIAFNDQHCERVMPIFGQDRMLQAQAKAGLDEEAYLSTRARIQRLAGPDGIDAVLQEHHLDALVAPTAIPAWPIDWVNGDCHTDSCSSPAAVSGYPHITVPAGYVSGLPVGISFFASAWQEPLLLRLAYAFEQALPVRQPPRYILHFP